MKGRASSRRRLQGHTSPKMPRHNVVDDVKAEASAALRSPGGKERIEDMPLHLVRHSLTVVRNDDLNVGRVETASTDQNASAVNAIEAVSNRIEDEIGEHLPVWPGEAVHHDVSRNLYDERTLRFLQAGP